MRIFQIVLGYIQSFPSHKTHFIEIFLSGESRFSNDFKIRVQYNDGELLSFGFVIGAFVGSQFVRHLGNAIRGKGELVVLPEQAIVVTRILDAIYQSAKTGKPVYFD